MIGKLLLIEWVKSRRRTAFWLALVGFTGILFLTLYPGYAAVRDNPEVSRPFAVMARWTMVLSVAASMGGAILASSLALLVSAESGWKTQRQNVIDGLSRNDYVVGKLVLGASLVFLLGAITFGMGSTFSLLYSRLGSDAGGPFADPLHYGMFGGLLLQFALMASVGIFFGLLLGSGGAALGSIVLFMIAQGGVLIPYLMYRGGVWAEMIPYLPASVNQSLRSAEAYDSTQMAEFIENSGTGLLPASGAALVALAYIALFAWGGLAATRYRDL